MYGQGGGQWRALVDVRGIFATAPSQWEHTPVTLVDVIGNSLPLTENQGVGSSILPWATTSTPLKSVGWSSGRGRAIGGKSVCTTYVWPKFETGLILAGLYFGR